MMDKDTGRPRGFGFVTFEGEAAVEACLAQPLEILGKPIEVKRAQPRGNLRDDDDQPGKFGRGRGRGGDRFNRGQGGGYDNGEGSQNMSGISPAAMAHMMAKMQTMSQMWSMMNYGGMNPQMMQQAGMNPAQMQQMQQMQQQQMQMARMQQAGGQGNQQMMGGMPGTPSGPRQSFGGQEQGGYDSQEQDRRGSSQGAGTPSSWEGMYDGVPQPGFGRGRGRSTPQPQSQAPLNAPTGPKNPGRPGANYRGGGRGHHRGYHPYSRNG